MLTDCVMFICLICVMSCLLIFTLNKVGYDFTLIDLIVLCLIGNIAFLVPFGLINFISAILFS